MCVYNPIAIDYRKGVDVYDPQTGFTYTEEQAHKQSPEVRKRLIIKARKIGCWVMDLHEAEIALKNQRK